MSADTGTKRLGYISRLTALTMSAVGRINRSPKMRDDGMIDRLLRALQLFKESQLGEVRRLRVETSEMDGQLSKTIRAKREAFRKRIDHFGEVAVEEELARGFPPRVRQYLNKHTLRWLLTHTETEILRLGRMGAQALVQFRDVLQDHGLSIGMSLAEAEELFGPQKVRVHIDMDDEDGHRVAGIKLVLRGENGMIYESAVCCNGAFFILIPGTYTVVEPEISIVDIRKRCFWPNYIDEIARSIVLRDEERWVEVYLRLRFSTN